MAVENGKLLSVVVVHWESELDPEGPAVLRERVQQPDGEITEVDFRLNKTDVIIKSARKKARESGKSVSVGHFYPRRMMEWVRAKQLSGS